MNEYCNITVNCDVKQKDGHKELTTGMYGDTMYGSVKIDVATESGKRMTFSFDRMTPYLGQMYAGCSGDRDFSTDPKD